MLEMQQLRGRADAVDVDLRRHYVATSFWGDYVVIWLLSSSVQGLDERDEAMFEGRAA